MNEQNFFEEVFFIQPEKVCLNGKERFNCTIVLRNKNSKTKVLSCIEQLINQFIFVNYFISIRFYSDCAFSRFKLVSLLQNKENWV